MLHLPFLTISSTVRPISGRALMTSSVESWLKGRACSMFCSVALRSASSVSIFEAVALACSVCETQTAVSEAV